MTLPAQTSLLPEPKPPKPKAKPERKPMTPAPPPAFQIYAVSTRYGRRTLTGFMRRWSRAVRTPKTLGAAIAKELQEAVELGEGLEVERCA